MPTTCVVVNCFNRHHKDSTIKFYRFTVDSDRRRQWVAFVSRRNEDGSPWQPKDGDRICSDHFILNQKSDIPTNPDYVPSILSRRVTETRDEEVVEALDPRLDHTQDQKHLNRFERAQQRRKKATEWDRLQGVEQERDAIYHKRTQKAFVHDHGSYCKPTGWEKMESLCNSDRQNFTRLIDKELTIPEEVGKFAS